MYKRPSFRLIYKNMQFPAYKQNILSKILINYKQSECYIKNI